MNKIKRSGRLLKASFAVLFREKKLLLFPFIATALAAGQMKAQAENAGQNAGGAGTLGGGN